MTDHPLDNPLWASLTSLHRGFAIGADEVARYPAEVAPFVAAARPGAGTAAALEALIAPGEEVLAVGPAPGVPAGWELASLGTIVQMVCEARVPEVAGPPIVALGDDHRAAVIELTALVYPHYFRPRTPELGRYFGIFDGGRLAAMSGERMGMPGWREISAVCTHPDFVGRGLARRLLAYLGNDILERGDTPFLHVSPHNERALRLYADNGYRTRRDIEFAALRRGAGA